MQSHHDCTRVARDSSGDLKVDHLQVQIHHDCIMMVMVCVLGLGPGRSVHNAPLRLPCGEHIRSYFLDVANFLNYFFKEKNLKLSNIAGYRITIVDWFA